MCFISYVLQVVARERMRLCDTPDPRKRMNTREPQERHERRSHTERMRVIGAKLEAWDGIQQARNCSSSWNAAFPPPWRVWGWNPDLSENFIVYGRHIFPSWPSLRLSRHPETPSPAPSSGGASSYQSKPAGSGVWGSQQVSISDNDLWNLSPSTRALTSVSSSTAQKVKSQQRKDKEGEEKKNTKIKNPCFVIFSFFLIHWFSHYCNFIKTIISSFIIMSYHKKVHLASSSFIIS